MLSESKKIVVGLPRLRIAPLLRGMGWCRLNEHQTCRKSPFEHRLGQQSGGSEPVKFRLGKQFLRSNNHWTTVESFQIRLKRFRELTWVGCILEIWQRNELETGYDFRAFPLDPDLSILIPSP